MSVNQVNQKRHPPQQPSQRQGVIGTPGGVVGNTRAALNMLLSALAESAPARHIGARTLALTSEGREELIVRRATPADFRGGARTRAVAEATVAARFTVVCNGVPTQVAPFEETRDLLARMPQLTHARWTLIDLERAPALYDGR